MLSNLEPRTSVSATVVENTRMTPSNAVTHLSHPPFR
jgi:hypothetical protein